jgi:hypothetical protein
MPFQPDTEQSSTAGKFVPDKPVQPKGETEKFIEGVPGKAFKTYAEIGRGAALPLLGAAETIPYEPLQKYAAGKIKEIEETPRAAKGIIDPRTMGKFAEEAGLTLVPGSKALQAESLLGRAGLGALSGATAGGVLTGAKKPEDIYKEKGEAAKSGAIFGGVAGATLPLVAQVSQKGYNAVRDTLQRAFGGDAKKLADALRDYATKRTGAEADAAKKLADQAEQRVGIAEKTMRQQETKGEAALRELPGTKTTEEAGRYKPIPESSQSIGERIKTYTDRVYQQLKDRRSANAERLKGEAFNEALSKEKAGERISNTNAFKKMIQEIDDANRHPDTKLSNMPVQEVRNQLLKVKNAVEGLKVDEATGTVIGQETSFEGLEQLRRFLSDRSYGLPAEGFDAISQQQAGRLAKQVEAVMEEFSPKIKTFINQYKADSEPLRVFKTKIGKVLTEEQIPGVRGYATTATEDIPSRVFKNKESYQSLLEAVGNNKPFAENEARKYFSNELEKLGGDPKRIEGFIRQNRDMLKETNSMNMVENYLKQVKSATTKAEQAGKIAKESTVTAEKQAARQQMFAKLQSDIMTAREPIDVARHYKDFAQKLLSDGTINQDQYRAMLQEANRIQTSVADTQAAKQEFAKGLTKIVGAGVLGTLGYYGSKAIGD